MNAHAVLICKELGRKFLVCKQFSLFVFDLLVSVQYNVNTEITTISLKGESLSIKKVRVHTLKEKRILFLAVLVDSYSFMQDESALLSDL